MCYQGHVEGLEGHLWMFWWSCRGSLKPSSGLGRPPWARFWVHFGACGGRLADLEGHVGAKRSGKSLEEEQERGQFQKCSFSMCV